MYRKLFIYKKTKCNVTFNKNIKLKISQKKYKEPFFLNKKNNKIITMSAFKY